VCKRQIYLCENIYGNNYRIEAFRIGHTPSFSFFLFTSFFYCPPASLAGGLQRKKKKKMRKKKI